MRFCVLFILFLVFCVGTVTAEIPCYNIPLGPYQPGYGTVRITVADYITDPQFTVDGNTAHFIPHTYEPEDITTYSATLTEGVHTLTIKTVGYKEFSDNAVHVCEGRDTVFSYKPEKLALKPQPQLLAKRNLTATTTTAAVVTTTTAPIITVTTVQGSSAPAAQQPVQQSGGNDYQSSGNGYSGSGQAASSQSGASQSGYSSSGTAATGSIAPSATGTLSVTTTPAGASIFIDGVQRGVLPADIPGLSPGDHTLLLKLDGYTDLSTPVSITAGETTKYNTGLAGAKKSPGFEALVGIIAIGAVLCMRKMRAG